MKEITDKTLDELKEALLDATIHNPGALLLSTLQAMSENLVEAENQIKDMEERDPELWKVFSSLLACIVDAMIALGTIEAMQHSPEEKLLYLSKLREMEK
jgi:hypothetical protein